MGVDAAWEFCNHFAPGDDNCEGLLIAAHADFLAARSTAGSRGEEGHIDDSAIVSAPLEESQPVTATEGSAVSATLEVPRVSGTPEPTKSKRHHNGSPGGASSPRSGGGSSNNSSVPWTPLHKMEALFGSGFLLYFAYMFWMARSMFRGKQSAPEEEVGLGKGRGKGGKSLKGKSSKASAIPVKPASAGGRPPGARSRSPTEREEKTFGEVDGGLLGGAAPASPPRTASRPSGHPATTPPTPTRALRAMMLGGQDPGTDDGQAAAGGGMRREVVDVASLEAIALLENQLAEAEGAAAALRLDKARAESAAASAEHAAREARQSAARAQASPHGGVRPPGAPTLSDLAAAEKVRLAAAAEEIRERDRKVGPSPILSQPL